MIDRRGISALTRGGLCILGVLGLLTLGWVTRWGPGTEPDSVVYVAAARSLLAGEGIRVPDWNSGTVVPMTHFPPLFPMLIAAVSLLGVEALQAARWLNAGLFGGSVVLAGAVVFRCTGRGWLAMLAGFVVLSSVHLIDVHVMAMSEPLFCFLGLGGLAMLGAYLESRRAAALVGSAVAIGLAFLTRYVGVALVGAGLFGLLLFGTRTRRRRIIDGVVFGTVSCLGVGVWAARNALSGGSMANRQTAFHPIDAAKLREGALAASRWYLPVSLPESVRVVFVVGLFAALLVLAFLPVSGSAGADRQTRPARRAPKTAGLLMIFVIAYLALLAISITFFDAHTPLDNRLLSPLNLAGVVVLFVALDKLLHYTRAVRVAGIVLVVVAAMFAGLKLKQNVEWNLRGRTDGEGYSSRKWQESKVIDRIEAMPAGKVIYSNWPEPIYLLTDRLTRNIPFQANPYTAAAREDYRTEVAAMAERLKATGGVLVYFDEPGRWYLPTREELDERMDLAIVYEDDHGVIYAVK